AAAHEEPLQPVGARAGIADEEDFGLGLFRQGSWPQVGGCPRYSSPYGSATSARDAAQAAPHGGEPARGPRHPRLPRARRDGVGAARVVPSTPPRGRGVRGRTAPPRPRPDHLPTVHRRAHALAPRPATRPPPPSDRPRLRPS